MSLDITPVTPEGRQVIQKYGDGGFQIAGVAFRSSVLVMMETSVSWDVSEPDMISVANLSALFESKASPGILLIGCGPKFVAPPKGLRQSLREQGAVLEWMDTGAACRTFNVLLTEERQVAAALIAVQ